MKLKYLSMSAAAAAMIAAGALAQDTATDGTMATEGSAAAEGVELIAPTFTSIEEMTVNDVLGLIVYDAAGESIGEIDYVIEGMAGVDAVIGIGGFLGLGEYTVAMPMSDFELGEDGRSFVVDTDKERLEQMPEFDESAAESLPGDTVIGSLMTDSSSMESGDAGTTGDTATDNDAAMGADAGAEAEVSTDGASAEPDASVEGDVSVDSDATEEGAATEETTPQ